MFKYDMSLCIAQTWIPYVAQGGGRRGSAIMKHAEKGMFLGLFVKIVYVYCVIPICVFILDFITF